MQTPENRPKLDRTTGSSFAVTVTAPMYASNIERTLERLRAEFLEMPGLRLTVNQAQRFCGVDQTICKAVLDALVDAKFLCVRSDGAYRRVSEGQLRRPTAAAHV